MAFLRVNAFGRIVSFDTSTLWVRSIDHPNEHNQYVQRAENNKLYAYIQVPCRKIFMENVKRIPIFLKNISM